MITIVSNAVTARLVNAPQEVRTAVSDLLSYAVEGAEFSYAFQNTGWNGRSTFYSMVNDTFPAGFVHMVHDELVRLGHRIQVGKKPAPEPLGDENPEPRLSDELTAVVKQNINKDLRLSKEQLQSLAKERLAEKEKQRARCIKLLEMIEVVIGEEAHEAGGNSYFEILKWCKNAEIRVALTATPFMRDNAESNMRLMGAFGPILIKVSEKTLIDRGILAKPIFMFASPPPHPKLRRTSPWQRAYQLEIMEGVGRNTRIVELAKKAAAHNLPTLVLVQRKEHGRKLREMLGEEGVTSIFIRGEHDQSERKAALKKLANGELQVLIGSTILDVGVDVPALGMIILAGGGKAEVAHRQRIGRGLRAKKSGPNVAFIVDFTDSTNSTLREHALTRRKIIEKTPGFAENILGIAKDFPWELFVTSLAA